MKTVSTKKTLLASVFAMLLCVSMFVGSTFAWFTSTATTSVNTIQAGNLKVELLAADGESPLGDSLKWVAKDGRDQDEIYWEPGCSYNLEGFRIKNGGNLALKYKVVISGLTGSAKLLEAIDFTVKMGEEEYTLEGWEDKLGAGDITDVITITGTMKADAGNDYMNEKIENISITVVATQDTVESDSNGNTYDQDAQYPATDVAGLKDAMEQGGEILFAADIDLKGAGGSEQVTIKKDGSVDLKGHTLSGMLSVGSYSSDDGVANVVIKDTAANGDYSVKAEYRREASGAMMQFAAIDVMKPTTTIESGRFASNNAVVNCQIQGVFGTDGTQWKFSAVNPQPLPAETLVGVIINGGSFEATDGGVCIAAVIGKVVVNGGSFSSGADGAIVVAESDSKQETSTVINDGEFKAAGVAFYFASADGKVVVNGGTFTVGSLKDGEGTLVINGGKFNVDPTAYLGEGHTATQDANGLWIVK